MNEDDFGVRLRPYIRRAQAAQAAANERRVRLLLEKWVSGCEPAIAYGPRGEILGLCDADAPIGTNPFIFRG